MVKSLKSASENEMNLRHGEKIRDAMTQGAGLRCEELLRESP